MFGVADPAAGTERIVVLAETDVVEAGAREALRNRAREVTVDAVGFAPDDIVLVRAWNCAEDAKRQNPSRGCQGVVSQRTPRRRSAHDAVADFAIVFGRICCALFPARLCAARQFVLCDLVVVRNHHQHCGGNDSRSCSAKSGVALGGSAGPCPDGACFGRSSTFRHRRRANSAIWRGAHVQSHKLRRCACPRCGSSGRTRLFGQKGICRSDDSWE